MHIKILLFGLFYNYAVPETRKNGKTLLLPEDKQSSTLKELATDRKVRDKRY